MTIAKLEKDKHLQNKFYGQNDFEYEVGEIVEDTSREPQGFFFCRDLARVIGFIDSQDNKNLVKSSYIFSPLVCFKVKALVNKHRYYSYDSNSFQASKIILEQMLPFYEMYEKAYNFNTDQETWFNELKALAVELGYATDRKKYKTNPEE